MFIKNVFAMPTMSTLPVITLLSIYLNTFYELMGAPLSYIRCARIGIQFHACNVLADPLSRTTQLLYRAGAFLGRCVRSVHVVRDGLVSLEIRKASPVHGDGVRPLLRDARVSADTTVAQASWHGALVWRVLRPFFLC